MFAQERPQSLFVFATSSKRENYQLTVSIQTRETVRHVSSPSLCTVTDLSEEVQRTDWISAGERHEDDFSAPTEGDHSLQK